MSKEQQAYDEILAALRKHKDVTLYNLYDLEQVADRHLFAVELRDVYGFNTIRPQDIRSREWTNFGKYMGIGMFGENYNRKISWSDDGRQPEEELLLCLRFPTGAYIFKAYGSCTEDYPIEIFQAFWQELKSYEPEYSDTANRNLYFSMDNAGIIFNAFPDIIKKYHELSRKDANARKVKKLEEEIIKLSKGTL